MHFETKLGEDVYYLIFKKNKLKKKQPVMDRTIYQFNLPKHQNGVGVDSIVKSSVPKSHALSQVDRKLMNTVADIFSSHKNKRDLQIKSNSHTENQVNNTINEPSDLMEEDIFADAGREYIPPFNPNLEKLKEDITLLPTLLEQEIPKPLSFAQNLKKKRIQRELEGDDFDEYMATETYIPEFMQDSKKPQSNKKSKMNKEYQVLTNHMKKKDKEEK